MVTSAGRGSPASSTIVINHDLIVWRMNELDIDVREFTRRTGVQEYSLNTRSLDPARISVALLIRIATVLDVGVEDLLLSAPTVPTAVPDAPDVADDPDVGTAPFRDDQVVEMVLVRYGAFRLEELAGVLRWTQVRTREAIEDLRTRWESGPLRLSGTVDDLEVGVRAGALDAEVRGRLDRRRIDLTPMTPREAEYLLALVRDDILRPVERVRAPLPHFERDADLRARGLIRVRREEGQVTSWPATWHAPTADFLFGLGLLTRPE
jgi:hypothetical protein